MAACGLTDGDENANTASASKAVNTMAKFAHNIMKKLEQINKVSFNNFKLKIGEKTTVYYSVFSECILTPYMSLHCWFTLI